ncbi:MAG: hypothetical protein ACTSRE_14415 [Promethearchaeota archaeon]
MKRKNIAFLIWVFCVFSFLPLVSAQQNWDWSSSYDDQGRALYLDGSYLYSAGFFASNETNDDGLVLKWDLEGNLEWSRTWNNNKREHFNSIDGKNGFVYTCGNIADNDLENSDLLLVKWDEQGNQIWNRTWGGLNTVVGVDVWVYNDTIYTSGLNEFEILLIKWDIDGIQIWNATWEGSSYAISYGGLCGDDDAIFLTAKSGIIGETDIIVQKWAHNGTLIWSKTWETEQSDYSYDIWINQNNIYVVGTTGLELLNQDLIIMAWDKNGTELWDIRWDLNDYDVGMGIWGDNNSLYISGHSVDWATTSYGGEVGFVMRCSLDGEIEAIFMIPNSKLAIDIIGDENSVFTLWLGSGENTQTDIHVSELAKDFESNSESIPGFPLLILAVVSISAVILIIKRQHKRISAN